MFFLFLSLLLSQNPEEILSRSEDILKGESSKGSFQMTVVTPAFTRVMEMNTWWEGNNALIEIRSPRREAGNRTLKVGNEMWLYLRNTETIIKIPPSMMLQPWMGSDFTNDDLVRESDPVEDYHLELLDNVVVEEHLCWKIRLTPKPHAVVVWGYLMYYVRQDDYMPARIEYYDERGVMTRYQQFYDVKEFHGRRIPSRWVMYNKVKEGHRTELKIIEIDFDIPIDDTIFSIRALER